MNDLTACFTVDVEQDCPPYLRTCRGMTEGLPVLLQLFRDTEVRATLFVTGEMARQFPQLMAEIVADGHELGCHGDTHPDFTRLGCRATDRELADSLATLRTFGPVTSFRAPYLRFPSEHLPLLVQHGITLDSSEARYKRGRNHRGARVDGLVRVPASVTSSLIRLPPVFVSAWLARLRRPLVLFVHPWEAVDFRASSLRWDCRWGTGAQARKRWAELIGRLRGRGFRFAAMRELAGDAVNPPGRAADQANHVDESRSIACSSAQQPARTGRLSRGGAQPPGALVVQTEKTAPGVRRPPSDF